MAEHETVLGDADKAAAHTTPRDGDTDLSVIQTVVDVLVREGTTHIFGVPGGGTSLDLINAARDRGIDFILTRTETGAVFMASTMADLSGTLGVAFATQGPGAASTVNGVANASLDKSPVVLFSDGWGEGHAVYDSHQWIDQAAMLAPLVKGHSSLTGAAPAQTFAGLAALAQTAPQGPVYVELTKEVCSRPAAKAPAPTHPPELAAPSLAQALALIGSARRPVILAGLEARRPEVSRALLQLAEALRCPVLTTYKAKGVIDSRHPLCVGLFTGGALESPCVSGADLVIQIGFDPVELIGKPWPYQAPVLDLGPVSYARAYTTPAATWRGDLAQGVASLAAACESSSWAPEAIAVLKADMARGLEYSGVSGGLSPVDVVRTVQAVIGPGQARASVDAGAHMFSAMAYWEARSPNDLMISNGLATMGYALPAAIAASLHEPGRPVVAFTGDGGLLMCAGELATAAAVGGKVIVVVFNDSGLSLIELKQKSRNMPQGDLRWPAVDFVAIASGAGISGYRATTLEELETAVTGALSHDGPSLIDVRVDPSGYQQQAHALRG